jgi:hypothetical protein
MSGSKPRGKGPLPGYGAADLIDTSTSKTVPFSGTIAATTFDHKTAFVRLDSPAPAEYAVISTDTPGCPNLMNGRGRLEKSIRVVGTAELGGDSLRAVSVAPEKP